MWLSSARSISSELYNNMTIFFRYWFRGQKNWCSNCEKWNTTCFLRKKGKTTVQRKFWRLLLFDVTALLILCNYFRFFRLFNSLLFYGRRRFTPICGEIQQVHTTLQMKILSYFPLCATFFPLRNGFLQIKAHVLQNIYLHFFIWKVIYVMTLNAY